MAVSPFLNKYFAAPIKIGSLSTPIFETRTANGSELFSLLTCLQTTTFTFLSTFSPLGMISIKIWETSLSLRAKCSLSVAVSVSKTRVLKLPNNLPVQTPSTKDTSSMAMSPVNEEPLIPSKVIYN